MRILVLGSTGMLGHKMVQKLSRHFSSVIGVSRPAFDATNAASVDSVVSFFHPDVVLNCTGWIKQREQDNITLTKVNAELPHLLQRISPYLIHFSSDCVFSGERGRYTEDDPTDAKDLYGKTKAAGEIRNASNALTIRTSIVGREICNFKGLLEWFLRQKGDIFGYDSHFFSGVTTQWLCETVIELLKRDQRLTGLYHVASKAISKADLLKLMQKTYGKTDVKIIPTSVGTVNRVLLADKFTAETKTALPNWEEMLYWMRKSDIEEGNYV